MSIRLLIQLSDEELPIHEYTRATTNVSGEGIRKLLLEACGWLQAYSASVSAEQWEADVRRVQRQASA